MKELSEFKAIIPDVFELWRDLTSQHYIPAAKSGRQFIEKMTETVFSKDWEFQFRRHGTVWPPNSGAQLHPEIADAENEIASRLVHFVMEPRQTRLDLAIGACERFLRELDVELLVRPGVNDLRVSGVELATSPEPGLPPHWLFGLAKEVRALVRLAEGMARFREMVRSWAREVEDWHTVANLGSLEGVPSGSLPYDDGIDLIPIPDRLMTLAEKYAVLAAVHDVCWKGEKINPWHPVPPLAPREAMRYVVLLCKFQDSQPDSDEWTIPDHDEHFLKEFLDDVRGDLETHKRRTQPKPPGPLLWPATNILGVSKQAVTLGKSIVKIRELNPDEKRLVIDDWVPFTSAMSTLSACMAPTCAAEDPRGGQVPIHKRSKFAEWFSANPDVEKLFQALWDARVDLPATFTQFERNLTDENLIRFKTALGDFEELVARFRAWYETICPATTFFSAPPTPSFPGTAAEYSSMLRSIRQSQEAEAVAAARTTPVSEKTAAKPFEAGTLVFFEDRVELCGVDICSGPRSVTSRKLLDQLRLKLENGSFAAYSGKELADKIQNSGGENSIGRLVGDLRDRITKFLREKANIECGDRGVILSGDEGYRFSPDLSVQDAEPGSDGTQQGHGMPAAAPNDPDVDTDDPDRDPDRDPDHDPDHDPDPGAADGPDFGETDELEVPGQAAKRRAWILQQLSAGRRLRAPNVVKQFECSLATAKRDLHALKNAGEIEFFGHDRTGYYRLKT